MLRFLLLSEYLMAFACVTEHMNVAADKNTTRTVDGFATGSCGIAGEHEARNHLRGAGRGESAVAQLVVCGIRAADPCARPLDPPGHWRLGRGVHCSDRERENPGFHAAHFVPLAQGWAGPAQWQRWGRPQPPPGGDPSPGHGPNPRAGAANP